MSINHGDTGKKADELKANMKKAGITFNPGDRSHHIVLSTDSKTVEAVLVRLRLKELGIGINDIDNGIAIPESQHKGQGLHRGTTYDAINRRLDAATSKAEAKVIL
jgi:A nuclease family of the HNH/ENDO VII superfamily with conserved AHH